MDSIQINNHGDIFIVTLDSAGRLMQSAKKELTDKTSTEEADKSYQALVDAIEDFLNNSADEYEEYDSGMEDEDIDSIVVVMRPGEAPSVMTESECYEAVEQHGSFCSVFTINDPDICAFDLKAAYDPKTVLKLGKERYIIGPVIVYACDRDGDSISLSAEDVMAAIVYFDGHSVMLCADGKDLPSFQI